MQLTNKPRAVAIVAIILSITIVSGLIIVPLILNPPGDSHTITVHLLQGAGVMIETNEMRVYIDPYCLLDSYTHLLADAILITHPHDDHYNATIVNLLQKNGTVNILPASMPDEVTLHDGVGVVPGDSVQVGSINITAFNMYTASYSYHPKDANWTSYIIDIEGFVIMHLGDAKNMTELTQLAGQIDLAFVPIYLWGIDVVDTIAKLQPRYFIPTHYDEGYLQIFLDTYSDEIAEVSECEIIALNYWSLRTFNH